MHKAVFLDRDGVINVDHGYIVKPSEFEFIDGVIEACKALQQQGYRLVIVTNQSGVARGYYNEDDVQQLHVWLHQQFTAHDVEIAGIYYCPHHSEKGLGDYKLDCDCRKPQPGMLLRAASELDIDLQQSIMVGDKESDLQAGINAGVAQCILVGDRLKLSRLASARYANLLEWQQAFSKEN
ncbi:D-glycero-beta-D-manno-heptose 1,7-bisphosphate 7-phosphatase [Alteromonadaceae bacterium BrNp21-10]|nr:D-glycero-beta-D-manno-heptose 1,7-bisphosphate 7-phosphatase [Alteromonadaceae bacterium BrNp21-10]